MDRKDPLLSHQYEAVNSLARNFKKVVVITGRVGEIEPNPKVQIISTDWVPGNGWSNLRQFISRSLPVILKGKFHSVFFHMTDLQCALLSPLIRLLGKRQYLWYAHTSKSKYLTFSYFWVTKVLTSTVGSCPISGSKVRAIGQAIDEEKFAVLPFGKLNLARLIHIGRFDKSKNIQDLVRAAIEIRDFFPDVQLTLIGSPANVESAKWAYELIHENEGNVNEGWLHFNEAIPREFFRQNVSQNGCFFHAYMGSLDKTLIESTMLRVPVVTLNPEYTAIFGTWGDKARITLVSEYCALRSIEASELQDELDRRLRIARRDHSLNHWVDELTSLLQ